MNDTTPDPNLTASEYLADDFSAKLAKLEPSRREKVLRAVRGSAGSFLHLRVLEHRRAKSPPTICRSSGWKNMRKIKELGGHSNRDGSSLGIVR